MTPAHRRMKCLLNAVALRRVKTQMQNGAPLLSLPRRDVYVEQIQLSEEERLAYDVMQHEGRIIVNK